MLEFLKNYPGYLEVNGKRIENDNLDNILNNTFGKIVINLIPKKESRSTDKIKSNERVVKNNTDTEYDIVVKPWMTKKSTEDFNFMLNWNNNIPMPFRYMRGVINKQTPGMYNMTLRGVPKNTETCSVCGKTLTNPISRLFGIGPECMQKCGIFGDITIEQAEQKLDEINKRIEETIWTGWIAKSAILQMTEVK